MHARTLQALPLIGSEVLQSPKLVMAELLRLERELEKQSSAACETVILRCSNYHLHPPHSPCQLAGKAHSVGATSMHSSRGEACSGLYRVADISRAACAQSARPDDRSERETVLAAAMVEGALDAQVCQVPAAGSKRERCQQGRNSKRDSEQHLEGYR